MYEEITRGYEIGFLITNLHLNVVHTSGLGDKIKGETNKTSYTIG